MRAVSIASGLAAALASATPAAADCVISRGNWFLGENASSRMTVKSGEPCLRTVTLNSGAAAIDSLRVVEKARHGLAGISGRSNYAYRSNPGFVGRDSFVVEIAGEKSRGGKGRTRITVEVTVEP